MRKLRNKSKDKFHINPQRNIEEVKPDVKKESLVRKSKLKNKPPLTEPPIDFELQWMENLNKAYMDSAN